MLHADIIVREAAQQTFALAVFPEHGAHRADISFIKIFVLASGSEGMLFTVVSVFGTLALGWFFGRKLLKVDSQTSYLLSSGTAICGGSAIAAVGL